jgi:MinD-like ATPase involved in chromosome partitioning or flagellar assembly
MKNDGNIITFYSFKGGVGRTMTLANVATQLAMWGFRVLCIDWDLEAPGLHLYFKNWINTRGTDGLVDLFHKFGQDLAVDWRECRTPVRVPSAHGRLDLIAAAGESDEYVHLLQSIDWQKLYADRDLGSYLENVRAEWQAEYDFTLLDSRTGITDIGGICTVQLPDCLILQFSANEQSLYGAVDVVRRAQRSRNALPYDRARLLVIPVATRFETRVEYALSQDWLDRFSDAFHDVFQEWLSDSANRAEFLSATKIPYVPFWSFGERVAVVDEGAHDPESMTFAIETITALVANHLENAHQILGGRDEYVRAAQSRGRATAHAVTLSPNRLLPRVVVIVAREDLPAIEELYPHLQQLHAKAWIGGIDRVVLDEASSNELGKEYWWDAGFIVLPLVSSAYLSVQGTSARAGIFGAENVADRSLTVRPSIVLPVVLRAFSWADAPFSTTDALPASGKPLLESSKRAASWASVAESIEDAAELLRLEQRVRYTEGDREFISALRALPRPLALAARRLLAGVRVRSPGHLEFAGRSGRYVNRPENFWTVKIQPWDQSLVITVRGDKARFEAHSRIITFKDDRPGYTRFKFSARRHVPSAIDVIRRAGRD